jgi:ADP-ribose pyrophosphatase YjhB (NUDIX family)
MSPSEPPGPVAWLHWVQQLQAIAQSGLAFSPDPYDRERYAQLRELAAAIASHHTDAPFVRIEGLFRQDSGYATPRLEVRGAVFDGEDRLLLVREVADNHRWSLPGGWVDVGDSPAEAIRSEILEESGYDTRITKLAAVWDRRRHPYPYGPFACVVMFFLAELIGGTASTSLETSAYGWFAADQWPSDLSLGRVLPMQLERMVLHHREPGLPTDFD